MNRASATREDGALQTGYKVRSKSARNRLGIGDKSGRDVQPTGTGETGAAEPADAGTVSAAGGRVSG